MRHSPGESIWLYGIHDAGGEQLMLDQSRLDRLLRGRRSRSGDFSGRCRTPQTGVIAGWYQALSSGDIPARQHHEDFAPLCELRQRQPRV